MSRPQANGRAGAGDIAPLVWTFDGPFAVCIADLEDALRRAIVQVGNASRLTVAIDVSLPALHKRVLAGDAVQPVWRECLDRLRARYGLPAPPRARYLQTQGPLLTLVVLYRR